MINPEDSKHISRLRRAMEASRKQLIPFRNNRTASIRQFVGRHYGDNGSNHRVPVNLIELAVNTYVRQLSANNPRLLVTTPSLNAKAKAAKFEIAINNLIREIRFNQTMKMAVTNAVFSIGIIKTGITTIGEVEVDGFTHDLGQPFADSVDLDDWVHDMSARRWDQIEFCGNKYRLPYEVVMDSKAYDNKKNLKPDKRSDTLDWEYGEDKAEDLSKDNSYDDDEYQDHVELWDIWLPMENLVLTLPCSGGQPIRVVEWEGPEYGPFNTLSFSEVPNNIMPLPPVAIWVDIHEMANATMRKLARQNDRQKTVLGVQRGKDPDGKRIVEASDGDAIAMDDPNSAREYRYGGIDQQSLGFLLQLNNLFSRHAGNLDILGGLSPQANTLGQEELISKTASKRMNEMQDRTQEFALRVCSDLGWHLWHDKFITLPMFKRIQNTNIDIPMYFSPEDREADYYEYTIDIHPYSMQEQSPYSKLQTIQNFFGQILAPFAGQLQQAGMTINWEGLIRTYAKYSNLAELEDILEFAQLMPQMMGASEPQAAGKPAHTKRTYERVNRPGVTASAQNAIMSAALMGGTPNPRNDQAAYAGAPS